MNHFFKKIRLINPEDKVDSIVNLWVKDGLIKHCSIDEADIDNETELIEGSELVAAPGFVDMHVHLREPGFEQKETIETGCEAAANGGFTEICCMPNTEPAIDNASVIEFIKSKAKNRLTTVHIAAAITQAREGKQLAPIKELNEYGAIYFTDDGDCIKDSTTMKLALDYTSIDKILLAQHCEDHSLTHNFAMNESRVSFQLGLKGYPTVAEEIILSRDIMLAEYCGNHRYHACHLSTKGSIDIMRIAKKRGQKLSCEVAPHHFSLTEEKLIAYDTNYKMNPPLRSKEDLEAIIEGIKDGTVDCIASDHAPHTLHEKDVEFEKAPNGIIGLESSVGIALTYLYNAGHVGLERIIELMSTKPRQILNLPKIRIDKDEKANLTIFHPSEDWVLEKSSIRSKSKNTPFIGSKLKGKPKYAINNNLIYKSIL